MSQFRQFPKFDSIVKPIAIPLDTLSIESAERHSAPYPAIVQMQRRHTESMNVTQKLQFLSPSLLTQSFSLPHDSDTPPLPMIETEAFTALSRSITFIPKEPKTSLQQTETLPLLPQKPVGKRMRAIIVLGSLLALLFVTLTSLAPVSGITSSFRRFQSASSWFQVTQSPWLILAQSVPTAIPVVTSNMPSLPTSSSNYVSIARQDAINAGISPDYFQRQITVESGFNPNAYSGAGAEGIAQFMPATAAGLGIDPWNPVSALNGAAHLMANYANMYGGNYAMALAAYNAGSGNVQYAVNACGGNWQACIPAETQNYIYLIMGI